MSHFLLQIFENSAYIDGKIQTFSSNSEVVYVCSKTERWELHQCLELMGTMILELFPFLSPGHSTYLAKAGFCSNCVTYISHHKMAVC